MLSCSQRTEFEQLSSEQLLGVREQLSGPTRVVEFLLASAYFKFLGLLRF
jgi:hypothetical protein